MSTYYRTALVRQASVALSAGVHSDSDDDNSPRGSLDGDEEIFNRLTSSNDITPQKNN